MKIYTKTGDNGETGLYGSPRVAKDDPRIEAYGTVDELNACLGLARVECASGLLDHVLARIQHELFALGAELATPQAAKHGMNMLNDQNVLAIESKIDELESELEPLRQFILPGGTRLAAAIHVARSVARRAERCLVTLRRLQPDDVSELTVRYLNRLGDLLFVMARSANASAGVADVPWEKPAARVNGDSDK